MAADFASKVFSITLNIFIVPVYIRLLGAESYGLVGLWATTTVLFGLLDLGLSKTVNREVARLSADASEREELRSTARTLEVFYWILGIVAGGGVIASSHFLATQWVKPGHLSGDVVKGAMRLMGLVIACQWSTSFYSGVLVGLQRQVLLSKLLVGCSILRGAGGCAVLWLVSPTIYTFFLWQMSMGVLQTALLVYVARQALPGEPNAGRFHPACLFRIWRYAGGVTLLSLLGTVLTQVDKVVLSKCLSLESFGHYALASSLASVVSLSAGSVANGIFPRLAQLYAVDGSTDKSPLTSVVYHKTCQVMSALVISPGLVFSWFSAELLRVWSGAPVVAPGMALSLALLSMGNAVNSVMVMPLMLQMAAGWTMLSVCKNVPAIVLVIPAMLLLTARYGAAGAASVWLGLNVAYFLFEPWMMHRRLLAGELRQWYTEDVGRPFLGAFAVCALSRVCMPQGPSIRLIVLWVSVTGVCTLAAAFLAARGGLELARAFLLEVADLRSRSRGPSVRAQR
jgi:O-antigen/teichoic acid export membrane protein